MIRRGRPLAIGLVTAMMAFGACAGTALATDYVAAPGGTGSTCTDALPCSITTALGLANGGSTANNAVLQAGNYDLTTSGTISVIHGLKAEQPGTRPAITSTNGNHVATSSASAHIEDVKIDISGVTTGRALDLVSGARADRVEVVSSNGVVLQLRDGSTLLDSVVRTSAASATAIVGGSGGGTLRNVTAVASGATSTGLSTFSGQTETVDVENSILRGTSHDIRALGTTGDNTVINVSYSDYVTSTQTGGTAANIVPGAGNVTETPLFANAAVGDFHELVGSPTIDKGFPVTGLGLSDFDGQARISGASPDIGADEFQTPPAPSATPKKKRKCKKHKKRAALSKKKKCKRKHH